MEARDLILSPSLTSSEIENFLHQFGITDTQSADLHIQRIVENTGVPERIAEFLEILLDGVSNTADPDAALTNFESYLEAVPSSLNLISHLQVDPRTADLLIGILGASPFLSQILIRNPEYLYWLAERNRIERIMGSDYFDDQASRAVQPFDTTADSMNALRRLKRRESLRIGAQDLLGHSTMSETVAQVSSLADSILKTTYQLLAREKLDPPGGFLVIALGKLGSKELNFSSDIDILFLFEDDERKREMHRFAREYAKILSEYSAEGHLYRVDLRLRPMGSRGEIAYSEKAIGHYYQTWADTSDRLAMIKCRPVAGDARFGKRFANLAADFVYKKFQDHAAVEEIHWIKKRTDQEIKKKPDSGQNIKLGLGGIREIEFFVQAFQILYGGLQPEIRSSNSLGGLQKLVEFGYLNSNDYEALSTAYVFLRNLEHKLQLVHDLQTHSLPEGQTELIKCARRMGYRSSRGDDVLLQEFSRDLENHNLRVREIFESFFEEKQEERGLGQIALNTVLPDEEAIEIMSEFGINNPVEVLDGIRLLQQAPAFPHSPTRMRNLLANLIPSLVEQSSLLSSPRDLFTRLDRFAENLGSRSELYSELAENSEFASRLFSLLGSGEFLSEKLIRNPEFLDYIARSIKTSDFKRDLSQFLVSVKDNSEFKDALRRFKEREEFKSGAQVMSDPANLNHRSDLSQVADSILEAALKHALAGTGLESEAFCLTALGKLGGCELTFHSDLDLLFILDDSKTARRASDFEPVLKRFKEILHSYTSKGRAYEVDFRLRPEGSRATEVVTRLQLENYFSSRVEAWERLAYTKNRIVFHSPEFTGFDLLNQLIYSTRFDDSDINLIRRIRSRKEVEIGKEKQNGVYDFKVGYGSLLDIQFTVQYLQIQHQVIEPNTLSAIDKLSSLGVLEIDVSEWFRKSLRILYSIESMTGLMRKEGRKLSVSPDKNQHLASLLGFESGEELLEQYLDVTKRVREIYEVLLR